MPRNLSLARTKSGTLRIAMIPRGEEDDVDIRDCDCDCECDCDCDPPNAPSSWIDRSTLDEATS